ncbi:hypothetical protein [Sphingomonas japonica]|uniref:Uncharacterized protein n=1 Tax=Sphingomonas japonica TaxID=511662 RepID=A0ABX0U4U7_9SPHN|nr:hypothetical protein [Sphingomonas japonica]NIJ24829.1 hypothetical protein [Sphingomonas japonica]
MARKPNEVEKTDEDKMISDSQGKNLPETNEAGERAPAVRDLPPANPLGEPVRPAEEYPNISEAGKQAAALGIKTEESNGDFPFGETIVEHPVSPTDAVPNPHGQRSNPDAEMVINTDVKGRATREPRDESGDVEVTGSDTLTEPVHLGDGRTLAKGDKAKVSKDVAKTLRDNKQVS